MRLRYLLVACFLSVVVLVSAVAVNLLLVPRTVVVENSSIDSVTMYRESWNPFAGENVSVTQGEEGEIWVGRYRVEMEGDFRNGSRNVSGNLSVTVLDELVIGELVVDQVTSRVVFSGCVVNLQGIGFFRDVSVDVCSEADRVRDSRDRCRGCVSV